MCNGIWISVECLKCGNLNENKYFVETLDEFNKVSDIKCSCGNDECEHFKLIDIDSQKGKEK